LYDEEQVAQHLLFPGGNVREDVLHEPVAHDVARWGLPPASPMRLLEGRPCPVPYS
jgi:hypothetical protein